MRSAQKVFFILFLLGFGFITFNASIISGDVVDRIVAVVNQDIITLSALNQSLKPYEEMIKKRNYTTEEAKKIILKTKHDLLNKLIDEKLKNQEAKKSYLFVSEEEVDRSMENFMRANVLTPEDLKEGLEKEGSSIKEFRAKIQDQILISKIVNIKVKSRIVIISDDLEKYYNEHISKYEGEIKYHLRNIILRVDAYAIESEKKEVYKRMIGILKKIERGSSFEELAKLYSESPRAPSGGDLGLFSLKNLNQKIREALKQINEGEVTSIIDTDQGYQIFYVQEIVRAGGKTLEEAKPEIEELLYKEAVQKAFDSWLEKLRERSHIRIKL